LRGHFGGRPATLNVPCVLQAIAVGIKTAVDAYWA